MRRPWTRRPGTRVVVLSATLVGLGMTGNSREDGADWRSYGGDPGGRRYSVLAQIDRGNVGRLQRAWTYHTADLEAGAAQATAFESTPLAVDGDLYVSTPSGRVIALDGDTGREEWTFRPPPRDGKRRGAGAAPRRVVLGVRRRLRSPHPDRKPDGRLFALDARTGRSRAEFGKDGVVDLRVGVADDWPNAPFGVSSPPAIYRDLVITGSLLQEYPALRPRGRRPRLRRRARAALVWRFHTVPRPGEPGHDTWEGESWKDRSGVERLVGDERRHRTRPRVPARRLRHLRLLRRRSQGREPLRATRVVALEAATGRVRWHFQTVHHDLWDYDLPAQPALVTVRRDGRDVAGGRAGHQERLRVRPGARDRAAPLPGGGAAGAGEHGARRSGVAHPAHSRCGRRRSSGSRSRASSSAR